VVSLYDAAGVDPEVAQAFASCLFTSEHDLPTTSLALAIILYQILEGDFFSAPSMREYCVGRDRVLGELLQGEVTMCIQRQETHGLHEAARV
jgi:hypothetical protein